MGGGGNTTLLHLSQSLLSHPPGGERESVEPSLDGVPGRVVRDRGPGQAGYWDRSQIRPYAHRGYRYWPFCST